MIASLAALLLVQGAQSHDSEVNELVQKFMTEHQVVGLSLSVTRDGKTIFSRGFGYKDLENKLSVDRNTRFRLASISKSVAATGLMQMVDAGKVDLDKDVRTYIPEWPDKGKLINLRMILGHRSGIRHYQSGKFGISYKEMSSGESIAMFKDDPLLFDPDTKYSYSTHAYTLVAAAIEKASGLTYPEYVSQRISQKIGAPSLQCETPTTSWPKDRSKHYAVLNGKLIADSKTENISWKYGGGGLESTADDLGKFGQAVMDAKLVSAKSRDAMWTDPEKDGYGLGWVVEKNRFSHSGSQQGARSYLIVQPQKKLVLVVLTNTGSNPIGTIANSVFDVFDKD
ncbi:MAG: beta-lactamase family protein [Fimbriimonadaceae bacterium]|nr:beta-lactamase family protein [Fimbriimonadaceae bacterium]